MPFHSIRRALRFTLKKAGLLLALAFTLRPMIQPAPAQLTIQIVNDSGLSDSNIFVMVPGKSGAQLDPQSLFVDKDTGSNNAVALSTLGVNGSAPPFEIVSPISGNTNTVYSFQTTLIESGNIYFIYNNPFTFVNGVTPNPAPDGGNGGSGYRYDYAELSFLGGDVNNDVDLTYVDKFGIPLQVEWFDGTNTAPASLVAGSYVYAATKTLANAFAASGFGNAVFSLTNAGAANGNITPGWQYPAGTNAYDNFARILAPQKISAGSPYPSVTNILDFLATHPFTLNGYSVQGNNYYLGYEVGVTKTNDPLTGIGEWLFTLAYNSNSLPAQYSLTAIGATSGQLQYTNTITFLVPNVTVATNFVTVTNTGNGDITTNTFFVTNGVDPNIYVYGAPSGTNYYLVNGAPPADTNTQPVELWMVGDVLSAINFGFAGGIYGNNSDQWFSPNVAWPDPYGWAQPAPQNQLASGYYNSYAALMYYNADAYTFAYSERITPDVGMAVKNGDVIRITILPDDRLDSPVVSVPTNSITPTSLTLNWSPVSGASGYRVNMLRPTGSLGFAPVEVSSATTNYTFSGLSNGVPCVMSVQAISTNPANGNPVITSARPIQATTLGTYAPPAGGTIPVLLSLNATDPFGRLASVSFNGQAVAGWKNNNSETVAFQAVAGTNQVLVTLKDNNSNTVFSDWLQFVAAEPFPVLNIGTNITADTSANSTNVSFTSLNSAISGVSLGGQNLSAPAPTTSGGWPAGGVGPVLATNDPYAIWVTNYTGSPTNFLVSVNGAAVAGNPGPTIGLSYGPAETRRFAPEGTANFPPVSPVVAITNVIALPAGGIQFNFNVPAGTNYVIESSGNLVDWQTIHNGVGQVGGEESYTNAAGTDTVQFYRIKL
jgi:hypothetical protein